jgi:hypothetical protein
MDDFMKYQRLRCIEESRLALEGENSQTEHNQNSSLKDNLRVVGQKSGRISNL